MNKRQIFKHLIKSGISPIPIGDGKRPSIKWKNFQNRFISDKEIEENVDDNSEIGIVCGKVSGNLEVIDVDLKYDNTGNLFTELLDIIKNHAPGVLEKLTVQKTKNGGYHLIYRCDKIEGNQKLAKRTTTDEERKIEGKENEKEVVLLETRGEGGYILCYPSNGYTIEKGKLLGIQKISIDERDLILDICRSFNQVFDTPIVRKKNPVFFSGESPFEDYNNNGDATNILEKHGWVVCATKGENIHFTRPGKNDGTTSATYHTQKRVLYVFTTSSQFEANKGYNNSSIYAILECDNDYKVLAQKLKSEGYGKSSTILDAGASDVLETRASVTSSEYKVEDVLYNSDEAEKYLKDVISGNLKMGLEVGMKELDKYFRFKRSNFVIVNGLDNVGKSTIIWYLQTLMSIKHGWRWLIYVGENSNNYISRKISEFYLCKNAKEMTIEDIKRGVNFVKEHFMMLKNTELINYKDVINMSKMVYDKKRFDGFLIDPYNALSIDIPSNSKFSVHDYHYQAASEIRTFGKQADIMMFLNCHVVTNAARMVDSDGHPRPPMKADTEGGQKFANRADDFLTLHRLTQHAEKYNESQIHVRKIKEHETGGNITLLNNPVILKMIPGGYGFVDQYGFNPITDKSIPQLQNNINFTKEIIDYTQPRTIEDEAPF